MELIFKTEKVTPRITRIYGFTSELMYLVEGDDRAALLDTGCGFGSLLDCVRRLTAKPVTVLLTHGHTDHALGAGEFDEVYISPPEKDVYAVHSELSFRKSSGTQWADFYKVSDSQIVSPLPFEKMKPLYPGDSFSLGGISVAAFACPGHTRGSLVFLIPEERILLLGDACNYLTFLFDDFSSTVEAYRASLATLSGQTAGKFDSVLLSHGDGRGVPDMLSRVSDVCDDILSGRSDRAPFSFLGADALLAKAVGQDGRRLDGGAGNIAYSDAKIR